MERAEILAYFKGLSPQEQNSLLCDLGKLDARGNPNGWIGNYRRELLNNKQGSCPHCDHKSYVKLGIDKGSQRYKCKSCNRNFTEYTGTWMAGLRRKDKIEEYLELMAEEKSLDAIKNALKINKKTALDWRHKILSSLRHTEEGSFKGITESDETFFRHSKKGQKMDDRLPRKRSSDFKKRGIGEDQITVVVTQDRQKEIDMSIGGLGRLEKQEIDKAIGARVSGQTILCTDSHVSYKGFAKDKQLEHCRLRTDLKQHLKHGVYHIQHVNSLHNRLKKWIDNEFWGVSTKYLQQYLNWFRVKELLKDSKNYLRDLVRLSLHDTQTLKRFQNIDTQYKVILSSLK